VKTPANAGISAVTMTFSNGGGTVSTDANGFYTKTLISGWSGCVTPSKIGYTFSPSSRCYTNVTTPQTNQNYTTVVVPVDDDIMGPLNLGSISCSPNPFSQSSLIKYTLNQAIQTDICVYDIRGRQVKKLYGAIQPRGEHLVNWDGTDEAGQVVGNGAYLIVVRAGNLISSTKVLMMR
ncbi:MAG: T9SS type A sorting domain-containing protein, partial [Candidatus Cloacimonetes bacterium]|nr:T9SS type A sorting domain-containing protein [Candidatus Cloacimonadota bacterium]